MHVFIVYRFIIIICYHHSAGDLQLNIRNKPYFYFGLYSCAAILYLQFMLHVTLFSLSNIVCFYTSTFQKVCAVPNMAIFFYSSLILCFPSVLLGYFLNGFEMVPFAPVIIAITFVFNHSTWALFLYFIFWDLLSFFLDHMSVSWNRNV